MKLSSLNASYTALLQGKVQFESEIRSYKKSIQEYQQVEHLYEASKSTIQKLEYEVQSLRLDNSHLRNRVEILSSVNIPSAAASLSKFPQREPTIRSTSPQVYEYSNNYTNSGSASNNIPTYDSYMDHTSDHESSVSYVPGKPKQMVSSGPKSLSHLLGNKLPINSDMNSASAYEPPANTNKAGKDDKYFKQLNENYSGKRQSLGDVVAAVPSVPTKPQSSSGAQYASPFATDIIQHELKSFDAMEKQLTSYMYEKTGLADEVDRYYILVKYIS